MCKASNYRQSDLVEMIQWVSEWSLFWVKEVKQSFCCLCLSTARVLPEHFLSTAWVQVKLASEFIGEFIQRSDPIRFAGYYKAVLSSEIITSIS